MPKYAVSREPYDDEEVSFNFKKGVPVQKTDEPMTTIHGHGRLPDEFHNA